MGGGPVCQAIAILVRSSIFPCSMAAAKVFYVHCRMRIAEEDKRQANIGKAGKDVGNLL